MGYRFDRFLPVGKLRRFKLETFIGLRGEPLDMAVDKRTRRNISAGRSLSCSRTWPFRTRFQPRQVPRYAKKVVVVSKYCVSVLSTIPICLKSTLDSRTVGLRISRALPTIYPPCTWLLPFASERLTGCDHPVSSTRNLDYALI